MPCVVSVVEILVVLIGSDLFWPLVSWPKEGPS
jgi:hypothetical protein